MTERWTDETLDRFASMVATAIQANNDAIAANRVESNERLTRIEQLVESNNRFLESFSQDLRRYTDNMDRLTQQLAATTSNANQDRMDSNTRLSVISGKLNTIDGKIDRLLQQES
jgi:hypothetical protein